MYSVQVFTFSNAGELTGKHGRPVFIGTMSADCSIVVQLCGLTESLSAAAVPAQLCVLTRVIGRSDDRTAASTVLPPSACRPGPSSGRRPRAPSNGNTPCLTRDPSRESQYWVSWWSQSGGFWAIRDDKRCLLRSHRASTWSAAWWSQSGGFWAVGRARLSQTSWSNIQGYVEIGLFFFITVKSKCQEYILERK